MAANSHTHVCGVTWRVPIDNSPIQHFKNTLIKCYICSLPASLKMQASLEDDESCSSHLKDHHDEIPPFALPDEVVRGSGNTCCTSSWPVHSSQINMKSSQHGHSMCTVEQSTHSQPPALASSIMSNHSDESLDGSAHYAHQAAEPYSVWKQHGNASLLTGDLLSSRHMEAAASLMVDMEGSYPLHSNHLQQMQASDLSQVPSSRRQRDGQHQLVVGPATTSRDNSYSSLGFSRLLHNADDTHEPLILHGSTLPVLQEGEEADSFHSAQCYPSASFPSNIPTTSSQIMTPDWVQMEKWASENDGYCPPTLPPQMNHTRSAASSLLGRSTMMRRTGIRVTQIDPTSFEVIMDISPGSSTSLEEAIDIMGNPSLLVLWCESVRSLVVTKSSEGSSSQDSAPDHTNRLRADYEGEWTEATTTDLISPPSASSCLYSTSKAVWSFIGFPSNYGTVKMFLERPKGRLGISIGPFAGDMSMSHTLTVRKVGDGVVEVHDRISLIPGTSTTELLCGAFDCLGSLFLPSMKGYMDQTVSSLMRLRLLIESGGQRQSCILKSNDNNC